jgi:glycosyltransferase involved in cell wall biosynthesis
MMKRVRNLGKTLRILTWHIHGSYLYYLTKCPCEFYLPVKDIKEEGYGGKTTNFSWGDNVYNVDADKVRDMEFDCIVFQSKKNYLEDQYNILSEEQRKLPKIYLEHDPPRQTPTDTKHIVDDPGVLLVHVTDFNNMMWDNNSTPSTVIRHGVIVNEKVKYTGELKKGIVVINGLPKRGRRLGLDIFEKVRQEIPLDIAGMGSEELGGLGEIPLKELHLFIASYRFFFNPIRYTSMGLAVCEAMMAGMPVIGLATTEMPMVIENDISGYIDTNVDNLIEKMKMLLQDNEKAIALSKGAKASASKMFNIERFTGDWMNTFSYVIQLKDQDENLNYRFKAGGLR